MRLPTIPLALIAAASALAGCMQPDDPALPPPAGLLREGPPQDEASCLRAVADKTGNTVAIISSTVSAGTTTVIVGVGPDSAEWQCLVSKGKVTTVMSLVNEGAL